MSTLKKNKKDDFKEVLEGEHYFRRDIQLELSILNCKMREQRHKLCKLKVKHSLLEATQTKILRKFRALHLDEI